MCWYLVSCSIRKSPASLWTSRASLLWWVSWTSSFMPLREIFWKCWLIDGKMYRRPWFSQPKIGFPLHGFPSNLWLLKWNQQSRLHVKLQLVNVFTVFRFHSMSSTYPHGIARSHRSMRSRLFCNPEICSKISPALLSLIFLACSNRAASGHSRTSVLKLCTHCGSRVLTSKDPAAFVQVPHKCWWIQTDNACI